MQTRLLSEQCFQRRYCWPLLLVVNAFFWLCGPLPTVSVSSSGTSRLVRTEKHLRIIIVISQKPVLCDWRIELASRACITGVSAAESRPLGRIKSATWATRNGAALSPRLLCYRTIVQQAYLDDECLVSSPPHTTILVLGMIDTLAQLAASNIRNVSVLR